MKYRVIHNDSEFFVLTEDGGCVAVHNNGNNNVSTYYQDRLTGIRNPSEVWDELAEGKTYHKEWANESIDEIIQDALDWLVSPSPNKWLKDDSIFNNKDFPWESQMNDEIMDALQFLSPILTTKIFPESSTMNNKPHLDENAVTNVCIRIMDFLVPEDPDKEEYDEEYDFETQDELKKIIEDWLQENSIPFIK